VAYRDLNFTFVLSEVALPLYDQWKFSECAEFDFIKFTSQLLAEQLQTKGDGQFTFGPYAGQHSSASVSSHRAHR
jgi:hypothetical protein